MSKFEHPVEMQLGPEAGSQAADHLPPHLGPAVHLILLLPLLDDTNVSRVIRQKVLSTVSIANWNCCPPECINPRLIALQNMHG